MPVPDDLEEPGRFVDELHAHIDFLDPDLIQGGSA